MASECHLREQTKREVIITTGILRKFLSVNKDLDPSFKDDSSRSLVRYCKGVLEFLDSYLKDLAQTLVPDLKEAIDGLRQTLQGLPVNDTHEQPCPLTPHVNQMPNNSAIALLLLTYFKVHGSLTIGKHDCHQLGTEIGVLTEQQKVYVKLSKTSPKDFMNADFTSLACHRPFMSTLKAIK